MRFAAGARSAIRQKAGNISGHAARLPVFPAAAIVANSRRRGFTLIEMIMTLVIVGILAAVVAPRFMGPSVFNTEGFTAEVRAALRYAQKAAIAQNRFVCVDFAADSVTLSLGATAACGTALASLNGEASYVVTAPSGVTFAGAPTSFNFNTRGEPSLGQTINITGGSNVIIIEAETGYVH
ncbi:MAG: type II secretion system protein [Gallionella sp.]|nr:type II secretion system protein [Gallionella sp.]